MKRKIILFSALAMLMGAVSPTFAASRITVKIAGMKPDGEPETIGMKLFAKYVMEKSKGKYDVRIYPNGQLGKEDAYIAKGQKGEIQMFASGTQTSSLFPAMAMLETPMLYEDMNHAHRAMNGTTFDLINKGFAEKTGLKMLNAFPLGFRHFYTKKEIATVQDLTGLSLRVPNIALYKEFAKQLGQDGKPMSFSEVPAALKSGLIQGGDSPFSDIVALKMYETTPNITLSGHILVIHSLYINKEFFDKMPPEDQKIFENAAKTAAEDVWQMAEAGEKKAIEEVIRGGGKINNPSPELKKALNQAGEKTWKLFYDTVPNAKEIIDSAKSYSKK